jgi:hypothetical protein
VVTAGLLLFCLWQWRRAVRQASPEQVAVFRKPVLSFATVYVVYYTVICFLASLGFFGPEPAPPRILLVFPPILLVVIVLLFSKTSRSLSFLPLISASSLIYIQAYRIVVEIILIGLFTEKIVPKELTLHGRNFDLIIGILAIPVGFWLSKNPVTGRKVALAFNALGLISLINIVAIVIPSLPTRFQQYATNYLPTYFPGILIAFVAPFAMYVHVLSIKQLLGMAHVIRDSRN